jgi:membrane protein required for colicin V production
MDSLSNLPVNPVDIVVLVIFLVLGVYGYIQGLVHVVLSLASWIGGVIVTVFAFPYVRPFARDIITVHPIAADFGAGIVVFIGSLVVFTVITRMFSSAVQGSSLNILDRSLGFLFGVVLSGLIVCAAFIGLQMLMPDPDARPDWIRNARTMPMIEGGATVLIDIIPDEYRDRLHMPDSGGGASDGGTSQLLQPAPKAPKPPENEGYEDAERSTLERLIDTAQ